MSSDHIEHLLVRERQERQAATSAQTAEARDSHVMLAERYADEAWSISESNPDSRFIPSGLWH